jgi:hypothetical protein
MRNRHPADQLADVRKDLEDLRIKERFLRTLLLETGDFRGEEWRAHPEERSQQRHSRSPRPTPSSGWCG